MVFSCYDVMIYLIRFYLEWFTLSNKDKFAGKVYLELTFWSNVSSRFQSFHRPLILDRNHLQKKRPLPNPQKLTDNTAVLDHLSH